MIVIFGLYHWLPRLVAFRADYCCHCESATTSVLVRTLDVLYIYWIPVLPVGRWSRWFCKACARRPHVAPRTRRDGFKMAGAIILALMILLFWFGVSPGAVEPSVLWTGRLLFPLALAFTLRSATRPTPAPKFKQRLAQVQPHKDSLAGLLLMAATSPTGRR